MNAHPTPASRQSGFTLLELLVALVVFGFILAGLSQGVRFGLRANDTQARLSSSRGDLDAVDRTLRRLIEQADPGDARSGPTLRGTESRLLFTSRLPAAAAATGTRHADITLAVDRDRRLLLGWTPHLHAQRLTPRPAPQVEELLQGLDHLELAYWSGIWSPAWDPALHKDLLPALIRLRLVFPPGDPRHWPDIVVALNRQRAD